MSRLSTQMKLKYYPYLVKRDGNKCFYCKAAFSANHRYEYDHLNSILKDSRPENLVLCHHECNVKKKYNSDHQIMAYEKLKLNEQSEYVCASITVEEQPLTSCQRINQQITEVTTNFLAEHTLNDEELPLTDTTYAITHITQDRFKCGSPDAVLRCIKVLSNSINGTYIIFKKDRKNFIKRKVET